MRELFIYYRVRRSNEVATRAAVTAFQARLKERHAVLIARLLQRPESSDGLQTWMETYRTDPMHQPAGVSPALQAEIEADAAERLSAHIEGPRHVEAFVACAS